MSPAESGAEDRELARQDTNAFIFNIFAFISLAVLAATTPLVLNGLSILILTGQLP